MEGETLAQVLQREGMLEPARAAEVGEALAVAHARGLVHRDITPGNVLVSSSGLVTVADFGIAKLAATPTLTGSGCCWARPATYRPSRPRAGRWTHGRICMR